MFYYSISNRGSRDVNEDSVGIIKGQNSTCFVVADGLGGHGKGDVASKIAISAFETVFSCEQEIPLREAMSTAFQKAQGDILAEQEKQGNLFQMKTTVAALALGENTVVYGHIGDTRIYTFAHNRVRERTLDHSVPQMLVMSKEIKERQIRHHPDRNKLLRVLGVAGDLPRYELSGTYDLSKCQAFLLCSDGFWELILEKEMCASLRKSHSAQEWMEKMCRVVESRGAGTDMDNYSAIAVQL